MNEAEIAHKILNRQNATSPVILMGEMQHVLGTEGYELALERRWIVPSWDSGELTVSDRPGVLDEMRQLASSVKTAPVAEAKTTNLYRLFSSNQNQKVILQTPEGLIEALAVGGENDKGAEIGDEVVVAEEGKPFTAVVQSKNEDGTYVLSFGQEKPRAVRPYAKEELRRTAAAPAGTGGRAAPAVTPQRP
jgi:hypothetical protein